MTEPAHRAIWVRLREVQRATRFRPFTIHLIDGRSFRVPGPQYLGLSPAGVTTLFLVFGDQEDRTEFLDLTYVQEIELHPTAAASA